MAGRWIISSYAMNDAIIIVGTLILLLTIFERMRLKYICNKLAEKNNFTISPKGLLGFEMKNELWTIHIRFKIWRWSVNNKGGIVANFKAKNPIEPFKAKVGIIRKWYPNVIIKKKTMTISTTSNDQKIAKAIKKEATSIYTTQMAITGTKETIDFETTLIDYGFKVKTEFTTKTFESIQNIHNILSGKPPQKNENISAEELIKNL